MTSRCRGRLHAALPVVFAATLWLLLAPALSSGLPSGLEDGGEALVTRVVDGDTLALDDGRELRLVGIRVPKRSLGRGGFKDLPFSERAKAVLEELALGETVALAYGGRRLDRYGRALAHVATRQPDSGSIGSRDFWLQGELLRRGFARVSGNPDNRAALRELLAFEQLARQTNRGLWAHPHFAVRAANAVARDIGSFQIVEGQVLEAAVVRGRAYLNFGSDWRSDFTVTLASRVRRLFEKEGHDPRNYAGERIRVRGWVRSYNGPQIGVTHPEQIEVLP